MASMLVNMFGLREDVQAYHLGGMGCSMGVVGLNLVRDLLAVGCGNGMHAQVHVHVNAARMGWGLHTCVWVARITPSRLWRKRGVAFPLPEKLRACAPAPKRNAHPPVDPPTHRRAPTASRCLSPTRSSPRGSTWVTARRPW